MASVDSQLIEEVTAHAQSDSLKDAREIGADVLTFRISYVLMIKCWRALYFILKIDIQKDTLKLSEFYTNL